MKKRIRLLLIICAVLLSCLILPGCNSAEQAEIEVRSPQRHMTAGSRQVLCVYDVQTDLRITEKLLFASSDPSVLTVSQNGTVTAVAQGAATIYVQHSESQARTAVGISVRYDVSHQPRYQAVTCGSPISAVGFSFWQQRGYTERISNWDLLQVAKILIGKSNGAYVFTDVYEQLRVCGEEVLLLSDWGNEDVILKRALPEIELLHFLEDRYQLSNLQKEALYRATADIKAAVSEQIDAYHGIIALSKLPETMEYRVYVSYDYTLLKVENYYSRGLLNGIGQLSSDILSGSIEGLLESYTYCETEYELVNGKSPTIVIEARDRAATEASS